MKKRNKEHIASRNCFSAKGATFQTVSIVLPFIRSSSIFYFISYNRYRRRPGSYLNGGEHSASREIKPRRLGADRGLEKRDTETVHLKSVRKRCDYGNNLLNYVCTSDFTLQPSCSGPADLG